jgi:hypothetical protein
MLVPCWRLTDMASTIADARRRRKRGCRGLSVACRLQVLSSSPVAAGVLGSLVYLGLDRQGVLKALHARLQILDFSLLLSEQQVFDLVQS